MAFTPHPPRVKISKAQMGRGVQRPPQGGLLGQGVAAFSKPSVGGDKQNMTAFKPPIVGG